MVGVDRLKGLLLLPSLCVEEVMCGGGGKNDNGNNNGDNEDDNKHQQRLDTILGPSNGGGGPGPPSDLWLLPLYLLPCFFLLVQSYCFEIV